MGHRNEYNYKLGAWWQNLRLVHNSTLFRGIFDTYVDPGSVFKFSIGFENVGKIGVKSPCVKGLSYSGVPRHDSDGQPSEHVLHIKTTLT